MADGNYDLISIDVIGIIGYQALPAIPVCNLIYRTIKEEEATPSKDPLKWFGFLVPNTLRQSQSSYRKAVEVTVECANLQNEINGVIARKKFLTRTLSKIEDEQKSS